MARQPAEGEVKKLTGAVEHLLGGERKPDPAALADQAALLGIDPEALLAGDDEDDDFQVWPEHEDVVLTFVLCRTQWRSTGGGVIGLDYSVVFQVMALYDVADRRAVLEDLQVMEFRAVEIMNKRAQEAMG